MSGASTEKEKQCRDYSELISAYRDGELSDGERKEVDKHMSECPACRDVLESVDRVARALADLPRHELQRDIAGDIEKMLSSEMARRSKPAEEEKRKSLVLMPMPRGRLFGLAAAAVALCAAAAYFMNTSNNLPEHLAGLSRTDEQSPGQKEDGERIADRGKANLSDQASGVDKPAVDNGSTQNRLPVSQPETATQSGAETNLHEEEMADAAASLRPSALDKSGGAHAPKMLARVPGAKKPGDDESFLAETNVDDGNVFGQIGVGTDEDGLYAIKM